MKHREESLTGLWGWGDSSLGTQRADGVREERFRDIRGRPRVTRNSRFGSALWTSSEWFEEKQKGISTYNARCVWIWAWHEWDVRESWPHLAAMWATLLPKVPEYPGIPCITKWCSRCKVGWWLKGCLQDKLCVHTAIVPRVLKGPEGPMRNQRESLSVRCTFHNVRNSFLNARKLCLASWCHVAEL